MEIPSDLHPSLDVFLLRIMSVSMADVSVGSDVVLYKKGGEISLRPFASLEREEYVHSF